MCFTLRLHMSAAPTQGGLTQALAPMRNNFIALSIFTTSLALLIGVALFFIWRPGLEDHQGVNKAYYEQRLRKLAGPTAIACRDTYIPFAGAQAPDCLTIAVHSSRPFHASLQFHPFGNSEALWIGLARDTSGKLFQLSYDPDITGGWGNKAEPVLQTYSCRSFDVPAVIQRPWLCGNGR
jgi:hypothetical protein